MWPSVLRILISGAVRFSKHDYKLIFAIRGQGSVRQAVFLLSSEFCSVEKSPLSWGSFSYFAGKWLQNKWCLSKIHQDGIVKSQQNQEECNTALVACTQSWCWEPNKKLMLPPLPIAISEQETFYQCTAICQSASITKAVFGVFLF